MFDNSGFGGYQSAVPYYRPQFAQQPMPRPMMPPMELIKVNGRAGAEAFQVAAPNSMVALFDANDDVFYIKSTDGAAYPTVKAYRFTPVTNEAPAAPDFVTRSEYDSFKNEIMEGIKNVQQFVSKASTAGTEAAAAK